MTQVAVDMTQAKASLETLRRAGIEADFAHLIARASALALSRNPKLNRLVCGYQMLSAGRVDIGLSIESAPTELPVVIVDAGSKGLAEIVAAVADAIAASRAQERRLERRAWLTPFGFLRRWLLRYFYGSFVARRRLAGTFEVNCSSGADMLVPLRFNTSAILSAGRVRDVVVDFDGEPAVRPMALLTLCLDHVAFDGVRAGVLINGIKEILEGDELLDDARQVRAAAERALHS
jgi:pyruvate/2-oxoglutarate dehydrogenase complex dihydrolipoamide acyltransferase (E2) component